MLALVREALARSIMAMGVEAGHAARQQPMLDLL